MTTKRPRYEVEWWGVPEETLRAERRPVLRAPRGGKRGYRSREEARAAIDAYVYRLGDIGGTIEAAHSPRIYEIRTR
jgi:hypothetical protein